MAGIAMDMDRGMECGDRGRNSSRGRRAAAVADVIIFFTAFFLLIKYLCTTRFSVFQYRLVGWDFFAHLMMFAIPAAVILLRGESLRDYGLGRGQLRDPDVKKTVRVSFTVLPVIWLAVASAAVLSGAYHLRLNMPPEWFGVWNKMSGLPFYLAGMSLTVLFEVVFCGVGEEVLFRGYIQGRINNALGRPWKIMGINVGWGLIISSLLFGFAHGLGTFNPFGGFNFSTYRFVWQEAIITGVQGLIFGLLRDRTGGIAASAVLHSAVCLMFGSIMLVS